MRQLRLALNFFRVGAEHDKQRHGPGCLRQTDRVVEEGFSSEGRQLQQLFRLAKARGGAGGKEHRRGEKQINV